MQPLILEVTLNAPMEAVFEAFISPDMLQRWFCPLGMTVQQAMSNTAVNGKFLLRLSDTMGNIHSLEGVYLNVDKYENLSFTWHWLDEDHKSQVNIDFTELDAATTHIKICHSNFPDQEDFDLHYQAWITCLEKLSVELSNTTES